jgi:hypothetical protein
MTPRRLASSNIHIASLLIGNSGGGADVSELSHVGRVTIDFPFV